MSDHHRPCRCGRNEDTARIATTQFACVRGGARPAPPRGGRGLQRGVRRDGRAHHCLSILLLSVSPAPLFRPLAYSRLSLSLSPLCLLPSSCSVSTLGLLSLTPPLSLHSLFTPLLSLPLHYLFSWLHCGLGKGNRPPLLNFVWLESPTQHTLTHTHHTGRCNVIAGNRHYFSHLCARF
jgi:hypothetical protein